MIPIKGKNYRKQFFSWQLSQIDMKFPTGLFAMCSHDKQTIHMARRPYDVLTIVTQQMNPTYGQMYPTTYRLQSHDELILHMARHPNDKLTAVTLQELTCYLAMQDYLPNHPIQHNTSR